jgi:hypothetical protein
MRSGLAKLRSPFIVFLLSWVVSVPFAFLHGPLDLRWVAAQALGAGVIPMIVGWWSLWRHNGSLKAGIIGASWAAGVLFLLAAVNRLMHGGA